MKRLLLVLLFASTLHAETLDYHRAIQLALAHSSTLASATADQTVAHQGYLEARSAYIPQLVVGSGLAKTFGFPMSIEGSAPSVFNVTSQSFLINPAQREFVKAAKKDWEASSISTEDRRNDVILDTTVTYVQLDKVLSQLQIVQTQSEASAKQQDVVQQRVQAGLDNAMEFTKAQLASARVTMRIEELRGLADQLRAHLSDLTGVPAQDLTTNSESIPVLNPPTDDDVVKKALAHSPSVRVADAAALAKQFRAVGEHKQWYPAVDFVGNYGLFTRYNNYDQFFQKFSRNNATIGVAIRFPFLNFAQRAHAGAADADALKSKKEAETVRGQVSNETLKARGAVRQLAAAREVARLEYELAKSESQAAHVRVQEGTANVKDEENARINEYGYYESLLDANFELQKAQLQLLRTTGELEKWAGR